MASGTIHVENDLLWTNAKPNTNFSPQTISLDLSGYSRVKIQFTPFGNTNQVEFSECVVGSASCLFYMQFSKDNTSSAGAFLNGVARNYSVTTTGVTFENGQMVYAGTAYTDWQNRSVPWKIFGIK